VVLVAAAMTSNSAHLPFAIRLIEPHERPALAPLLVELLEHYAMISPGEDAIRQALADQPQGVEMLVAFAPGGPVGFASFAQLFPGLGSDPQIYMKELYVAAPWRSAGVGEALMRALSRVGAARGCTRIDWSTSRTNDRGIAFYLRIGAHVVEEKVYFRLDAEGIAALAAARR
jgi:ribosomal protein S18 acetylase RimI-like enzyme